MVSSLDGQYCHSPYAVKGELKLNLCNTCYIFVLLMFLRGKVMQKPSKQFSFLVHVYENVTGLRRTVNAGTHIRCCLLNVCESQYN